MSPIARFAVVPYVCIVHPSLPARTLAETRSRTVTLSDPQNLLSIATIVESRSLNGKTYKSTYNAGAKTITHETPLLRQTVLTLNASGRVSKVERPGIAAVTTQYDANGRPWTIAQGARTYTLGYDSVGRLASLVDPLHTFGLGYDDANQPTSLVLPNSTSIILTWDPNGNLKTVTPPGRLPHVFDYQGADLEQDYTPPTVAGTEGHVHTTYDIDQSVFSWSVDGLPSISPAYETSSGRLKTLGFNAATYTYGYHPTQGAGINACTQIAQCLTSAQLTFRPLSCERCVAGRDANRHAGGISRFQKRARISARCFARRSPAADPVSRRGSGHL